MKIMLVVNEFPPEKIAGTAMATQALAEHLTRKGHAVCVVVTTPCPAEKQQAIQPHTYQLHWLKRRPLKGLGGWWRLWQTWVIAKAFQPEVMQGQAVSCGLIVGLLGRWMGVPSICYAQGYDVYQASWWQRKTEIRWGCSLPTRCLAVTKNLEHAIQQVVGVNIRQMPHAFDLPTLQQSRAEIRQHYGLQDDTKLVLNVARLESFKGHDVLLKAWQECILVHTDAQLWIAGTGSQKSTLEAMVKSLGLQANVRFLDYILPLEVHSLMEAADIFVLPSREEPFGIVLLEAMAHGLPVVASHVGGIPEVLPAEGETWLVAADDEKALARAMLEALQGDAASGVNGVYALDFTWEKQVQRFEMLYQELVSEGKC